MVTKLKARVADFLTEHADPVTNTVFFVSAFLAIIIYILHVITHFPFFDGTIHLRYLWLIASGLRANVDFFCIYPTLGYFLTIPFFKLFPESAFVLLALRLFSGVMIALVGIVFYTHGKRIINDWVVALLPFLLICTDRSIGVFFAEYSVDHIAAVFALWAMSIFFQQPGTGRLAFSAMLSAISVFIMPKYHLPLFLGLTGYVAAYYLDCRKVRPVVIGLAVGAGAALLLVTLIFSANHGSLVNNMKYAFLFNFRLSSVLGTTIGDSPLYAPVLVFLLSFLRFHPVLSMTFVLGLAGWVSYVLKNRNRMDQVMLGGGGILAGTVIGSFGHAVYCDQYLAPALFTLALFVPFAFTDLLTAPRLRSVMRASLVAIVCTIIVARLYYVADEFELTPYNSRGDTKTSRKLLGNIVMAPTGINILNEYDDLLDIIPPGERVVAAWPYHPLFRRDVTFHIFDDRPSLSCGFASDDPLMKTFSPEYFRGELEKSPPALIALGNLSENYPPGWDTVAQQFLDRHHEQYEPYKTRLYDGFIRKDLVTSE